MGQCYFHERLRKEIRSCLSTVAGVPRAAAVERVSAHPTTIHLHPTIPIIHKNGRRGKAETCAAADTSEERFKQTTGAWKRRCAKAFPRSRQERRERVRKENWAREFCDVCRQAPRLEPTTPTLKNAKIFIITPESRLSGRKHPRVHSPDSAGNRI
ncbi:hypothetical protein E2C01_017824 [Portunus trituberculatus]|uniref:Uncharacterized protein n=1 Tax=Portunus trituberculatus TaxID=210409 RepID=A0A5B7DTG6_PORTR|nr:hypothetical protein [Portunus trituberculatus]